MSGQVDIEVAPGLIEVGVEVLLEGSARKALVGVEDLLSGIAILRRKHSEKDCGPDAGRGSPALMGGSRPGPGSKTC